MILNSFRCHLNWRGKKISFCFQLKIYELTMNITLNGKHLRKRFSIGLWSKTGPNWWAPRQELGEEASSLPVPQKKPFGRKRWGSLERRKIIGDAENCGQWSVWELMPDRRSSPARRSSGVPGPYLVQQQAWWRLAGRYSGNGAETEKPIIREIIIETDSGHDMKSWHI